MNKRERVARAVRDARGCHDPDDPDAFPCRLCNIKEGCFAMADVTMAAHLAALAEEEPSEAEIEAAYGAFRVETGDLTEALTAALRAARKARMG